jgi:hypothetical protein
MLAAAHPAAHSRRRRQVAVCGVCCVCTQSQVVHSSQLCNNSKQTKIQQIMNGRKSSVSAGATG